MSSESTWSAVPATLPVEDFAPSSSLGKRPLSPETHEDQMIRDIVLSLPVPPILIDATETQASSPLQATQPRSSSSKTSTTKSINKKFGKPLEPRCDECIRLHFSCNKGKPRCNTCIRRGRVCSYHGVITMSSEQQRELNRINAEGGVRYTSTSNRTVPLPLQDPCSICKHGAVKKNCRTCTKILRSYCEHTRIKRQCRICASHSFCIHDRRKAECKECGGNAICCHGRIKYACPTCRAQKEEVQKKKADASSKK